jgi:hypothetical protein
VRDTAHCIPWAFSPCQVRPLPIPNNFRRAVSHNRRKSPRRGGFSDRNFIESENRLKRKYFRRARYQDRRKSPHREACRLSRVRDTAHCIPWAFSPCQVRPLPIPNNFRRAVSHNRRKSTQRRILGGEFLSDRNLQNLHGADGQARIANGPGI